VEAQKIARQVQIISPFKQYAEHMNIFIIYAESNERGADDSPEIEIVDTVFDSCYGHYGIRRLLYLKNYDVMEEYLKLIPGKVDGVILTVNDTRYGGGGANMLLFQKATLPQLTMN